MKPITLPSITVRMCITYRCMLCICRPGARTSHPCAFGLTTQLWGSLVWTGTWRIWPAKAKCTSTRSPASMDSPRVQKKSDDNCRMLFPRVPRAVSMADASSGHISLRRDHPHLVPYARALLLALPCNQAVYLTGDDGRYVAEHALWDRTGRKGQPPRKLSPAQNAGLAAKYGTSTLR